MFDMLVIGAGPVGLFTLFEAGMVGLSSCIVDTLPKVGGQCAELYPQKPIYDIPAYPVISGQELIDKLMQQCAPFNPAFVLNEQVVSCDFDSMSKIFQVETASGRIISAKTVILAAGNGAFLPRKPEIENLETFENHSVLYSISDVSVFRDKSVTILGGGDSAIDWAIELAKIAYKVYVVHRRDKFRAAEASIKKMHQLAEQQLIEILVPYQLCDLKGEGKNISSVILKDWNGNTKSIKTDYLLPFFGLNMNLGPLASWGLEMQGKKIKVDSSSMQSTISGIFAVGDVAHYPGKLKLILTGFAEAALACHSAYDIIYPDKPLHFQYSTSKGVPHQ